MGRVLEELERVRISADAAAVHDLRVAIRRCRSVAAIMEEVDSHQTWNAVKRLPRRLFRALGTLRDLHVLETWVEQFAAVDDPSRSKVRSILKAREGAARKHVRRALRHFDQESWKRLARKASNRARLVPPSSSTAHCLALERYEDLYRLHTHAVPKDAPRPWHALRVGLKRFRYALEILLPARSIEWDDGLQQMQGLLGEIHDLDVLRSWLSHESDGIDADAVRSLRHAIATKRGACLAQYRERTSGPGRLLHEWRAGFGDGTAIASATAARLRTTARAMDPHPRRTTIVARLALEVYDGLRTSRVGRRLQDNRLHMILGAAAQLHGIDVDGRKTPRHKAARDFLRAAPVPPGWSLPDWALLTQVVRYHRGAEPATRHKQFAQLTPKRQQDVRGLAGILRLARDLRRCGVSDTGSVRIDESPAYVRLRVSGLQNTEDDAARLAVAKHLLETYLRRPILIEPSGVSVHGPRLAYSAAHSQRSVVPGVRSVSREHQPPGTDSTRRTRTSDLRGVEPHLGGATVALAR